MDLRYEPAFINRVRQRIDIPERGAVEVWAARPEDVIVGKLMAWEEGRSSRHTSDIYEMMLFYYLGGVSELTFDETYVTGRAREISEEAASVWLLIQESAQEAASQA
jgi:hypothetical protein